MNNFRSLKVTRVDNNSAPYVKQGEPGNQKLNELSNLL